MKNETFLLTGGTGSWGWELVTQLLTKHPKEVRIYSGNEALQVEMNHIIGDISSVSSMAPFINSAPTGAVFFIDVRD
ncbi:hypothetical protein AYJ08_15950 [Brevibacillus sp. SKDU10]|uniref:polysaccharide biosynthesis protein n=1 Tax=Brevibacillus sp. SKDU10 TaxID=1247872 RepID=UPI0007C91E80|nr:hypothetical protein AYJ08_15950 [Brevibacillus sp. SKDU10]